VRGRFVCAVSSLVLCRVSLRRYMQPILNSLSELFKILLDVLRNVRIKQTTQNVPVVTPQLCPVTSTPQPALVTQPLITQPETVTPNVVTLPASTGFLICPVQRKDPKEGLPLTSRTAEIGKKRGRNGDRHSCLGICVVLYCYGSLCSRRHRWICLLHS